MGPWPNCPRAARVPRQRAGRDEREPDSGLGWRHELMNQLIDDNFKC